MIKKKRRPHAGNNVWWKITAILPCKFNSGTSQRVSFEFHAVIRYVYARTPLPFSNKRRLLFSLFCELSPPSTFLAIKKIYTTVPSLFPLLSLRNLDLCYLHVSIRFFFPSSFHLCPCVVSTDILTSHHSQFPTLTTLVIRPICSAKAEGQRANELIIRFLE